MLAFNENSEVKKYQERNSDGEKNHKPKQLEDAPSLELLKTMLDGALLNLI